MDSQKVTVIIISIIFIIGLYGDAGSIKYKLYAHIHINYKLQSAIAMQNRWHIRNLNHKTSGLVKKN